MGFSERDKLKALAIVHIFETSKPLGDYSAVAVLNDGAGISYGINQFTHRSGSLAAVLDRYAKLKGRTHGVVASVLQDLRSGSKISMHSANSQLKTVLANMGGEPEMQRAQREIAFEMYMQPAIDACEGSDFTLPLSLAVVYDSINHGSFGKIRDRVQLNFPASIKPEEFEREWISTYIRKRDEWLESIPRLKSTDYRTDFFLAQIARGNWNLDLPLNVHGYRLTDATIDTMLPKQEEGVIFEIPQAEESRPEAHSLLPVAVPTTSVPALEAAIPQAEAQQQIAENIVNVGGESAVPDNFVPEEKTADAAEPTGFIGKLKMHIAGLGIGGGALAFVKEFFGISLSPETVELLKIVIPTALGLGFIGFLTWYVSEKVVGFKTLKMQAEINTDPNRHNLTIRPK